VPAAAALPVAAPAIVALAGAKSDVLVLVLAVCAEKLAVAVVALSVAV